MISKYSPDFYKSQLIHCIEKGDVATLSTIVMQPNCFSVICNNMTVGGSQLTILEYACQKNQSDCYNILLNLVLDKIANNELKKEILNKDRALYYVVNYHQVKSIKRLADAGASIHEYNISSSNSKVQSCLHVAIKHKASGMLAFLLSHFQCDLNQKVRAPLSPKEFATKYNLQYVITEAYDLMHHGVQTFLKFALILQNHVNLDVNMEQPLISMLMIKEILEKICHVILPSVDFDAFYRKASSPTFLQIDSAVLTAEYYNACAMRYRKQCNNIAMNTFFRNISEEGRDLQNIISVTLDSSSNAVDKAALLQQAITRFIQAKFSLDSRLYPIKSTTLQHLQECGLLTEKHQEMFDELEPGYFKPKEDNLLQDFHVSFC